MKRKIYYRAFLPKEGTYTNNSYTWYSSLVDVNGIDEFLTDVQIKHMKNRLVGGWRNIIPFNITWHNGEIYNLDYSI